MNISSFSSFRRLGLVDCGVRNLNTTSDVIVRNTGLRVIIAVDVQGTKTRFLSSNRIPTRHSLQRVHLASIGSHPIAIGLHERRSAVFEPATEVFRYNELRRRSKGSNRIVVLLQASR